MDKTRISVANGWKLRGMVQECSIQYRKGSNMLHGKLSGLKNRCRRMAVVLTVLAALAAWYCPVSAAGFFDESFLLGANRGGAALRPENTLPAFTHAQSLSASIVIKTEARLTSDGKVVLIADETVNRTTNGSGSVASMTLSQIQALDAAFWFTTNQGATYPLRGQGLVVPTLQAALSAATTARFQIQLMGTNTALADAVLSIVAAAGAESRVLLSSTDAAMMQRVRLVNPTIATCYDPTNLVSMIATYLSGDWDAYVPQAEVVSILKNELTTYGLTPSVITAVRAKGIQFQVSVLNTEIDIESFLTLGVDGILSDDPDLLAEVIDGWGEEEDDTIPEGGYGTIQTVGMGTDAITLVKVGGSRYEMGYWYGKLLASQIAAACDSMFEYAGVPEDLLNLAVNAMFKPQYFDTESYQQEFEGIVAGCAEAGYPQVTVKRLQYMHVIPDLSEVGCSLFAAWGNATADGHLYQLRNLDWIMDAGVQNYPVVAIYEPRDGNVHATVGFAGMIGAIGGINEHGMAQSQIMGYFCDSEGINGVPMPILLREVLYHDSTLDEALTRMRNATRTNEYYYCISDANAPDPQARLLLTSASRFDEYTDNQSVNPHPCQTPTPFHTAMDDVVYWRKHNGSGNDIIYNYIHGNYGAMDHLKSIEVAKAAGVSGTLMSIVYDATDLEFWVAFANGASQPAHTQGYVHFDLEPGGFRGEAYRTSVGDGADKIPVIVVSGTPFEMGYHYGRLIKDEATQFVNAFRAMALAEDATRYSDLALDWSWIAMMSHIDSRYWEEMQGFALGSGIKLDLVRRTHTIPMLASFSCSSVAAWGNATANGHLLQTRDLDWEIAAAAFPCIVIYKPTNGNPHMNVSFAGFMGSHTGINAQGIALSEIGDSPNSEYPYNLVGTHFSIMFRTMLYDADNLTEAIDILTNTTRIKRYHYVIGDGKNEMAAVKVKAHAPETPPNDLIIWRDNAPNDEFAPNVFDDIVYNDEGRGAYPYLSAEYGSLTPEKMITLANSIAMTNSNTMNVVYDATTLEAWVAYAEGNEKAYQRPYVYIDMNEYIAPPEPDADNDGIPDSVEGSGDADLDGIPNYIDIDSDGDGIRDADEGDADADLDGIPNYLDTDSDDDGLPDEVEGTDDPDEDGLPNYLDPDSDNDKIPDGEDGLNDPDGDGIPSFLDTDSDDDGLLDEYETAADADGDGIPNHEDADSDDDGIPDALEMETGTDPYDASDPGGGITFRAVDMTDLLALDFYAGSLSDGSLIQGRMALFGAASNDGRQVAFWGLNASTLKAAIFVVNIGAPYSWRRLTTDYATLPDSPLSWTPDNLAIIQGTTRVRVADGKTYIYKPFGYRLTEQTCTRAATGNWLIGTYNTDPLMRDDQKEDLMAIPILGNGEVDTRREPIQITNFTSRGYMALEWPSVAPDLSSVAFVRVPYPSPDTTREYGHVYVLTGLDEILEAGTLPGSNISALAPTTLSNARVKPIRVSDDYTDAPYFSGNARYVFYSEDWNQRFSGGPSAFSRFPSCNFDVMISGAQGINAPQRLTLTGNQAFAAPTPGGTRLAYMGYESFRSRLKIASLEVRTQVEGEPGNDNDIVVTAGAVFEDDANTSVFVPAGATLEFPAGVSHVVGIRTPTLPPSSTELPAGIDLAITTRSFLPTTLTSSQPLTVSIPYTTTQAAGIHEPALRLFKYDEVNGQFNTEITDSLEIDTVNNVISFHTSSFGTFALLADWDTDSDGIPDRIDPDDDDDGIPDVDDTYPLDTDNDGIPNALDDDDDGDGVTDGEDPMPYDSDNDGIPIGLDDDDDADGIPDDVDMYPFDTDNDGIRNDRDPDDDNDGIPDLIEGMDDPDGDGIVSCFDKDSDGDGIPDALEGWEDLDGDGLPNFKDTDSDGDGIPDNVEGTNDMDQDRIPNFKDTDSDGDTIRDKDEGLGDVDQDGAPNYLDLDSDGDGLLDSFEAKVNRGSVYQKPLDSDVDGVPDYLDLDSDGDGIDDNEYLEQWDATEGSQDTDSDGIPNYLDLDSDNDGLNDDFEMTIGTNPYNADTDGDGVADRAEHDNGTDPLEIESHPALNVAPAVLECSSTAGAASFAVNNVGIGAMEWTAAKAKGTSWFDITSGGAGVNAGEIRVSYEANDSPVQRTGEIRIVASDSLNSPFTVMLVQNGCDPPAPPAGVAASDGAYSDRVRVSWTPVAGATGYQVYRNVSNSTTGARAVSGWVQTAQFDDTTALPPKTATSGCNGAETTEFTKYYYWVKSQNDCVESAFGSSDIGWSGSGSIAKENETTYQKVLPSNKAAQTILSACRDASLYVRLRAEEDFDPAAIWGLVSTAAFETAGVEWFPVTEGLLNDIWVVFTPAAPWPAGDEITMTAGAVTISGQAIEATYAFRVETETEALVRLLKTGTNVAQPAVSEPNTPLAVALSDTEAQEIPSVLGSVGPVYDVGSAEAFITPQRVWLPVPGVDASQVTLYYYQQEGGDQGWYPAANVEGWLVPGSESTLVQNGTTYFGVLIRHGGIVQLAAPPNGEAAVPSPAGHSAGDLLVWTVAVVLLALIGRIRARQQAEH